MYENELESINRRLEECGGLFTWCLVHPRWFRLLEPSLKVGENKVMQYADKEGSIEMFEVFVMVHPRVIIRETPGGFELDYADFRKKLPPFHIVDQYRYGFVEG
jgi:hypothetical protein